MCENRRVMVVCWSRYRDKQRRRLLQRGPLLQHHNSLVPVLFRAKFPIPTAVGGVPQGVLPQRLLLAGTRMCGEYRSLAGGAPQTPEPRRSAVRPSTSGTAPPS
jgi:hypothetical protein